MLNVLNLKKKKEESHRPCCSATKCSTPWCWTARVLLHRIRWCFLVIRLFERHITWNKVNDINHVNMVNTCKTKKVHKYGFI